MTTCQAIKIQPGGGETYRCGKPTIQGSAYCAEHIRSTP